MLKKDVAKLFLSTIAATFFAACGDDTTTEKIVEVAGGTVIVESVGDLPECTKDIEGERAWVKTESIDRICVGGKWFATKGSLNAGDFSCTTKELKDKSGIKIVCNGDSIGVVLNGSDGKDGKAGTSGKDGNDGAGCAVVDQTDSTVVVKCGGQTMTLNLGAASGLDSLGLDSERIAVSLDTLAGVSQKGPFLKGSTVYLYELYDGHTLKQTNGNFVSNITSDDGRFRFTTRNLMSQYALIVVDGKYRNEVTGKPTNTAIRMQAYTDVLNRKNANVNLLTQLEMNRVYYLVTQKKKRFKVAKHQAQMEIFDAFYIDTTVINKSSEDLNVFGSTEADAALLAISIMLQGDSNETALSVLLTEIADDMESDGKWDDSVTKARIADWVATADTAGKLAEIRGYVNGWGVSKDSVPNFEKFVRTFWNKELGLGVCGDKNNPFGTVKHVSNPNSTKYYATEYTDVTSKGGKIRFICVDADGAKWRPATNIEKDTMTFGHKYKDGEVAHGRVNKDLIYVYEDNKWRHGTALDSVLDKGCVPGRGDTVALGKDSVWYKCVADTSMKMEESDWESAWRAASDLEKDTYESLKECSKDGVYGDGTLLNGRINNENLYVCDNGEFRYATSQEIEMNKGCVSYINGENYPFGKMKYYYTCKSKEWILDRDNWVTDPRDGTTYRTVTIGNQVIMAENLSYEYKVVKKSSGDTIVYGNHCFWDKNYEEILDSCKTRGRYYIWSAAMDSAAVFSDDGKGCTIDRMACTRNFPVRGVCPEGWHIPDSTEWATLYAFVDEDIRRLQATGFDNDYWRNATDEFGLSLRPAGLYREDSFDNGSMAYLWTSSMNYTDDMDTYYNSFRYVPYNWNVSNHGSFSAGRYSKNNNGEAITLRQLRGRYFSVRCFKN